MKIWINSQEYSYSIYFNSIETFILKEALEYVADDLGLGIGWAIVLISAAIKVSFMPLMIKAQLNALKMKLIEPEMKNFQNLTQRLQKAGDWNGMKQSRIQFSNLREKHGISSIVPILSLSQVKIISFHI